eukprot:3240788-Pleurochrysis_carterae.AAC.1
MLPTLDCACHLACQASADRIQLRSVLTAPGSTRRSQEMRLFKRESHSVLGSVFLNPTVAAGVAFGSGGTQLRKGPAYTERALYCRVDEDRRVLLVNELGLEGLPDGTVPYDSAEGKALLAR